MVCTIPKCKVHKKINKKHPLTNVKGCDQSTLGRIDLCPILQGQILLRPEATLKGTL